MSCTRFVCVGVILISTLVFAQSDRSRLADQLNKLPVVHALHPEAQPIPQMPRAMPLAHFGSGEFEATAPWRGRAPKAGINFAKAVAYGSGAELASSVAMADVNGDGKPDIVVANVCAGIFNNGCPTDGSVAVMLGNGDGTFQTAVTYDSGGHEAFSIAIADVNADGKPDIVVANWCASSSGCAEETEDGSAGVLLGNGDGTFQNVVTYDSGGIYSMSVAAADVNGDGKPDLLVTSQCVINNCSGGGVVGVLLGNGDGTFKSVVTYGSGGRSAGAVAVADVNGDGRPDLVVANGGGGSNNDGTVGVLLGNGDGTFKKGVPYDSGGCSAQSVAVADVNGDGVLDVLVANQGATNNCGDGLAGVLLGRGDGTFKAVVTYGTGGWESNHVAVADINEDGNPDLLVTNGCASSTNCNHGTTAVLLGDGKGMFRRAGIFGSGGTGPTSVTATDVNGDGKPDLILANNCTSGDGFNGCTNYNGAVGVLINTTKIGTGVTFSPTSLTFPTQLVFTTSPTQTVTLTNSGSGVLTIDRISVTGPFKQINNCPSTLYPNAHCRIKAKFHPTEKGVQNGSVEVTDNAIGSPQKVPLTGTGTLVMLTPAKLNFGTQPVGTRSLPKRIAVTNKGDVAVNITSISVTGADAGDFAETNNCGKQLASGASCFVKVTFKPVMKGKRAADISISDDGGGSPQKAGLAGIGT
jgi:hypothetical protein